MLFKYKEKSKRIAFIVLVMSIIVFILYNVFINGNNVIALSKYGSRGQEVTQIQTKLKRWGYYKGSIDGIYGETDFHYLMRHEIKEL